MNAYLNDPSTLFLALAAFFGLILGWARVRLLSILMVAALVAVGGAHLGYWHFQALPDWAWAIIILAVGAGALELVLTIILGRAATEQIFAYAVGAGLLALLWSGPKAALRALWADLRGVRGG